MYKLVTNNLSAFRYENDKGHTAQVFLDDVPNAKIVFRLNDKKAVTTILSENVQSPYWYFSECCMKTGSIMIEHQEEILALLDRWVKIMLLLHAMDNARAENEPFLMALCETLHIPFDERHPKYSEDLCLRILMKELAGYQEFEMFLNEKERITL
jgi:hypothetical protein